jgi:hypothetical protein
VRQRLRTGETLFNNRQSRIGRSRRRRTEVVKHVREKFGDLRGLTPLDLAAVHHVQRLAVAEKRHGRRRWRIAGEKTTQVGNGGFVPAREYGSHSRGPHGMLKGQADRRPGPACGAPANRIHHHQHFAASGPKQPVEITGSSGLFHSISSQVCAHIGNELFRVRHNLILPAAGRCAAVCRCLSGGSFSTLRIPPMNSFTGSNLALSTAGPLISPLGVALACGGSLLARFPLPRQALGLGGTAAVANRQPTAAQDGIVPHIGCHSITRGPVTELDYPPDAFGVCPA